MFNVRPNLRVPGFTVREPEEEVPGFRLNADGTIGKSPMTAAKPNDNPFDMLEPQPLAAWPPPYLAVARGAGIGGPGRPADDGEPPFPSAAAGERRTDVPGFRVNADGADQTLQSPGQSQMSGDVIPICSLFARTPSVCVYRCEKGANVATPNNGYCPSIIRQPPWL